jgi:RHS repeat-associated protein
MQYFYHPDHLGSASFVTDREGAVCQHIQYLPFGELFVSQRNCEFDSRYKFTAKELDNETSYTYFGARYYDSDLSVWLSVDPMSDMRSWVSPYAYCQNNPIILVDPRGMIDDNYRIYYDGTIEKDETNDPTNTYIYVNSDYEETNLGTYQVEKNSMGEDMVRAGNGATGSNGIYRWVGIISGNLYFPEDAFAALLGGIQDFYENVGQNVDLVQINQFMSLDRAHSKKGNRRPCLDIAYYDQNGKTGVHTDNPNVSYNLNYKLFQSLRYFKLGSYDTYTSTARGSKIPYLSETTGSKGHENHFHIEGYDKSNLFIFRNIMLPTITIIDNKINN